MRTGHAATRMSCEAIAMRPNVYIMIGVCKNIRFYFSSWSVNIHTMLYPSSPLVSLVTQFPSESRLKETHDREAEQMAAHFNIWVVLPSSIM